VRRLGRKPGLCVSVGAALAVLAGAGLAGAAGAATSAAAGPATPAAVATVKLSAGPLGVDIAQWDPDYSTSAALGVVQPLLKAAGVDEIHYSGGVTADQYDWENDTDISNCPQDEQDPAEFAAPCVQTDALDFTQLSDDARALGAQTFATVNYGTGTPAMAADWVEQATTTPGQAVADWEIGNESYGCWEQNSELAGAPEVYDPLPDGYVTNSATCPMVAEGQEAGMETMADSYAANAAQFMAAMRTADPSAQIGVPWAFDDTVAGADVGDNDVWNDTVLTDDQPDFVDAHWYPFMFGGVMGTDGNPTAQAVIQSVKQIPSEYVKIQNTLNAYDPTRGAKVIVGETGASNLVTNVPCTPVGALFAAGDVLEWLAAGAQSVSWWTLDTNANENNSTGCHPDEGMFTEYQNTPTQTLPAPLSPYVGYLLASTLARPGAELSSLISDPTNVLAFQSVLPDGQVAVALINTDTSSAQKVKVGTSLAGNLSTESYSAGNQNAADTKIVDGTTTAGAIAGGITLPAESILVLTSHAPSKVTLGAAASVKAGTKVTLSGRLTRNGAAAPVGTAVKIYRRVAGSSVNSATLTATTKAGGAFTATDLPPAYGSYDYVASYPGSSVYKSASSSVLVHVTAIKPTLKLAISAKTVKPGGKVTVTATLGAWHTNRTLVIYTQPKGSARKVVERATINAKGQLSVVYAVRANTTFTVTFSGDRWYTSASVTGTVKT
jgi:hypothetical protein